MVSKLLDSDQFHCVFLSRYIICILYLHPSPVASSNNEINANPIWSKLDLALTHFRDSPVLGYIPIHSSFVVTSDSSGSKKLRWKITHRIG